MSGSFSISSVDWLKLVLLSLLWGVSFIFMEVALEELGTFTIVTARVGIAAITMNILLAFKGRNVFHYKEHFLSFAIMGVVANVIPFSLIVWGQIYVTASLSAILNATLPFFTLIVAHLFTKDEKITSGRVVALLIGFSGVVMIIGPGALLETMDLFFVFGELAILLAVFCYSLMITYGRRFGRLGIPPLVAVTGQMTVATIILIPVALIMEQPLAEPMPSLSVVGSLLGIGVLSTALAFAIWYHLLNRIGSNNTSLVTFMIPVSAILMGYFILGEVLEWNQCIGLGLIIAGLVVINPRLSRRYAWIKM